MKTVLVVEDELDIRFAVRDLLLDEGYTVLEAGHGEEALAQIAARRPDVILTDLMMPILDGEQFLRRLRERKEHRTIPVVIMSAGGDGERIAAKYGASFVSKPFIIETLLEQLEAALAKGTKR